MRLPFEKCGLSVLALVMGSAAIFWAGPGTPVLRAADTFIVKESVSIEWADVLRVTPNYQTVTARRNEQVCESDKDADSKADDETPRAGWLESLRSIGRKVTSVTTRDRVTGHGCRMVEVERKFQRPISFDVDYVFRGMKFRTRLPEDPGSKLRIRVGVKPIIE